MLTPVIGFTGIVLFAGELCLLLFNGALEWMMSSLSLHEVLSAAKTWWKEPAEEEPMIADFIWGRDLVFRVQRLEDVIWRIFATM